MSALPKALRHSPPYRPTTAAFFDLDQCDPLRRPDIVVLIAPDRHGSGGHKWGKSMLLNQYSAARSIVLGLFFFIAFSPALVLSATSDGGGEFSLEVVEGEGISLEANDASLEAILTQLSEAINLPIRALVDDTARVTVSFRDLPLEEAMQRLSNRVIYVHDPKSGAIDRIVVLPEGEEPAPRTLETAKAAEPQPFKFEFDPSQAAED